MTALVEITPQDVENAPVKKELIKCTRNLSSDTFKKRYIQTCFVDMYISQLAPSLRYRWFDLTGVLV